MKIRLNEIPQDGRAYTFDRKSGELNSILQDLVETRPYDVNFFIKPIGNAYEVRGKIDAQVHEVCSRCGYDFDLPISRQVNEILFEEQEDHRKSHSVHGNQSVDFLGKGPSMTAVKGDIFDAGEYVHEQIALEEPFYPMCGGNGKCLHEDEVREIQRRLENEMNEAEEKTPGHPAFDVLKGLNLSSKD